MRLFFAVSVCAVPFSATASCSGHAECDADTDETSMLQVHARMQRNDADRAELLALQQQVHHLSNIEARQITLIGDFLAWTGDSQLEAVHGLPHLLQDLSVVQGYIAALQHTKRIAEVLKSSASYIQGDSSSPAESVRSFLDEYRVALQETTEIAGEFSAEEVREGILGQWCPGIHLMTEHVRDMFQTEGLETNANALSHVSPGDEDEEQSNVALLQGVDMKNLQTQQLSEEQTVVLKHQLKAALMGLGTQEAFIEHVGDSFVRWCTEDIAQNCPPIDYPILSGPIRQMVERCVDTFGQVTALGRLADGSDIERD